MAATKKREALGAGLSALFGDEDFTSLPSDAASTLPLSKIEPRIDQPREYFDDEALNVLSDSIAQYGVIQPITVRKLESGIYQIIAGERRWRAARQAGLTEIPVRIIEADDKTTAQLALVENLQREDLNPIEEAKGYRKLMEEYGLTQDQTAKAVGKSRPAITNATRLLNLSNNVLEMVEKGTLSAGHARALIPITDETAQLEAAKEVVNKNYSVRKTEAMVSKMLKPKEDVDQSQSENIDYAQEISILLSKSMGRKVKLTEGKNTGKIEIEFYGDEDREMLISKLKKL